MGAYSGTALYVAWVSAGGTTVLTGDHRTFTYTPSVDMIDATAGGDTSKVYIPNLKDGQCSVSLVAQAAGTAIQNALVEGTSGTLLVGPEGTVSTKQKMTIPAISMGVKWNVPYNDVVELTCDFQQAAARTDGAW